MIFSLTNFAVRLSLLLHIVFLLPHKKYFGPKLPFYVLQDLFLIIRRPFPFRLNFWCPFSAPLCASPAEWKQVFYLLETRARRALRQRRQIRAKGNYWILAHSRLINFYLKSILIVCRRCDDVFVFEARGNCKWFMVISSNWRWKRRQRRRNQMLKIWANLAALSRAAEWIVSERVWKDGIFVRNTARPDLSYFLFISQLLPFYRRLWGNIFPEKILLFT